MLSTFQTNLFWHEVQGIQERHAAMFPISQLQYIILGESGVFLSEEHSLDYVIEDEIRFAYKLVCDLDETMLSELEKFIPK